MSTPSVMVRGPAMAGARRSVAPADVIVALAAFGLTLALLAHGDRSSRGLDAVAVVLAALACLPLIAHRRAPLAVLAVTTAASATINGLGYVLGPPFGPTIALFYVAADERTRARPGRTATVLVSLFALHVGVTSIVRSSPAVPLLAGLVVWGGAWIAGDQLRQRRQRRAELVARARRTEHELQRERRLAAAEERTRIARDLHDSAAHAINVILVQAGAARMLQYRDPERVADALTTIEHVARETIGEIDHLIRGLRDGEAPGDARTGVEPPAGLAATSQLVAMHRAAGLSAEIRTQGSVRSLAPRADQAVYRVIQESLTNAARHGDGSARVDIVYHDDHLELAVSNPVAMTAGPVAAHTGGHGILGMRERVALVGGSLRAGPRDDRFEVVAELPYRDAAAGT